MAFTETAVFETIMGDRVFGCYKLTGDGSDTTWTAPLGTIDASWIQEYTTGATGTSLSVSWATNVLTFSVAPASSQIVLAFYVGV
jgi:hypothetical protein